MVYLLHPCQWLRRILRFQCVGFLRELYVSCPYNRRMCSSRHALDVNILIFGVLYFGYKWIKRTKFWKPEEMDFVTVSIH